MARDPVVQAFKDNDPRFEELFTAALAEPRAWERFSTPDSEGKTLFGYVNDRFPEFELDESTVAEEGKTQMRTAYDAFLKTQEPLVRSIGRLLIAGALPAEHEVEALVAGDARPEPSSLAKVIRESPTKTTALLHTYKTNKSEFEDLFKHSLTCKDEYLKKLILSAKSANGESLYSLAATANDYALLKTLRELKIEGRLEDVLEPQQLTRLLRELEPGTLGGLKTYEQVTPAYISKIKEGLQLNSGIHPQDDDGMAYLRFTAVEDSPAAKALLVPRGTPSTTILLEKWIHKQTEYLNSSSRIRDVVKAYTYHGDRLVNTYMRRTLTHPLELMKSIQPDLKFPLAHQVLDVYDELLTKGMVGPPVQDMWLSAGEVNHEAVMKLYNNNFAFFNRLNVLYPLVNAYRKELSKIIKQSPRLGYDRVVFRGVQEESYHAPGTIGYVTDSFVSTSLNPRIAHNFGNAPIYGTGFGQFIYEITIPAEIPCLYLEGITGVQGEAEVLLPSNLKIHAKYETTLKHISFRVDADSIDTFVGDLADAERNVVRTMKIVGYAPFQEPLTVATRKTAKTIKNSNRKPKAPFIGRNRTNNYTRRANYRNFRK